MNTHALYQQLSTLRHPELGSGSPENVLPIIVIRHSAEDAELNSV